MSVDVGKEGRLVIPKKIREKYGAEEGSKLIIRALKGQIILIPTTRYEEPTKALHGSISVEKPIEEPKEVAKQHIREKISEDLK